jgi:hypothetical protein
MQRKETYNSDSPLEANSQGFLLIALMDVQALVGIEIGKWVAKIDAELVLFRHLEDYIQE